MGPVYDYQQLLDDPQVQHNGSFVTYDHPTEGTVTTPGFAFRLGAQPQEVYRPAPLNGEHTHEILAELGLSAEQISELETGDAVYRGEAPVMTR